MQFPFCSAVKYFFSTKFSSIKAFNACSTVKTSSKLKWFRLIRGNHVLPGFKCPSWSAIDPRFTFSMTAPFREDGNVLPPTIFKPNMSSPSVFFLSIIWPIIRWPSADTCQLTGFCLFQLRFRVFCFSSYKTKHNFVRRVRGRFFLWNL